MAIHPKLSDSVQTCIAIGSQSNPFDRMVYQMGDTVKRIRNGLVRYRGGNANFVRVTAAAKGYKGRSPWLVLVAALAPSRP